MGMALDHYAIPIDIILKSVSKILARRVIGIQ